MVLHASLLISGTISGTKLRYDILSYWYGTKTTERYGTKVRYWIFFWVRITKNQSYRTVLHALDDSIIENLLNLSDNKAKTRAATNMSEASLAIEGFDNTPRVNRSENLFHWWHCHPHSDLKSLAEIVIALPVTQASVERTFSGLNYILSERRSSLKADIINSIMLLRCNTWCNTYVRM